jgi:hypothetical protein
MAHGEVAAHIVALAFGLQDHVVVLAGEVGDGHLDAVGLQVWGPAGVGLLAAPVGVKVCGVLRKGLGVELVVDVEVLQVGDVVLVFDGDAGPGVEGHLEVAVERRAAAEGVQFPLLGGDRERQRIVGAGQGVQQAEEITQGRNDAGGLLVIPVHLDDDLAVVIRVHHFPADAQRVVDFQHRHAHQFGGDLAGARLDPAGLGHPDVRDGARALDVRQDAFLAGHDDPVVAVSAGLVPAGGAGRAGGGELGQAREQA